MQHGVENHPSEGGRDGTAEAALQPLGKPLASKLSKQQIFRDSEYVGLGVAKIPKLEFSRCNQKTHLARVSHRLSQHTKFNFGFKNPSYVGYKSKLNSNEIVMWRFEGAKSLILESLRVG